MQVKRRSYQTVEMQMGPMIDMVFLLLVFFMVTARPVKQESDISLALPGTVSQETSIDIPDEQRIVITPAGEIALNDLVVGTAQDQDLPALLKTLKRFKEASDANKSEALITIDAADTAQHQRIVDVLNVCAKSSITNVTFADGAEEGEEP